jgi:BMFP domain-containing protein YqiC
MKETRMRGDPRLIDDLSRLASGAVGTLNTMRAEAREQLRSRVRRALGGSDENLREEVAAALELAANARAEQEKLQERVAALEARLAKLEGAKPAGKRSPKSDLDGKQLA